MFAEANTSPGRKVAKPLQTQDIPVFSSQKKNESVTQKVTKQCDETVFAGITAIHVASTFGKVKVVEYIVNAKNEREPFGFSIDSEEVMTSVHKVEPYQLAVLHRQDQILGIMTSHITSSKLYTDAYQNVFHTSMKLAVQDDNSRSLKILVSGGRGITQYLIHHCAFLIAIQNRRMKCIKCLVKKGVKLWPLTISRIVYRCPCLLTRDDVIKDLLLQDDNTIVKELLQLKGVGCRYMLYYAVFYDNTSVATHILENYKRRLLKEKPYHELPVVIQAVLNNSTRILEILLQSNYAQTRYKHYTALNWARAFHYDRCALLLENAGVPYDIDATQNYPPLVMLFEANITSFYYSKSALISRLLEHGNDVNRESVNGKTALYTALASRAYSSVRQLLMAGADPFFGRNCLTNFLSLRLIGELLYANVDIFRSRHEGSLLHQVLFSFPDLQSHLSLLLQHAHTIPKCNIKLLTALHDSTTLSPHTLDQINRFLLTPKTLVHRSRDVVRSNSGYKIHDLVRTSNLPSQIKSILTLEGSLECFLSLSFDEKKVT
ncbi:uncharacterized protein LOC110446884 isoform X2 [Mizuhopecten yessoensis]|nr:uncharacterized protein LOC110446884 isoform X2 [Mizuhopecten yessoensis]